MAKIVIASRIFNPDPGAAAARLTIATKSLSEAFDDITVLTTKSRHGEASDFSINVGIKRTPVLRGKDGSVRGYIPYLSFDIPLFFRLLTTRRFNLVLCEPPPTTGLAVLLATKLRRKPYAYYACDILSDAAEAQNVHPSVVRFLRKLESLIFKNASAVFTVSEYTTKRVRELANVNPISTSFGVDLELVHKSYPFPAGWPTTTGPVFVYAGTVAEWMGVTNFVDAATTVFERYPDARFVFIGQGSGWDALQEKISLLKDDRIIAKSTLGAQEAQAWLCNATASFAAILPGKYQDAYTTKVLTSLAVGTPVIYAGVGPAADDITTNNLGIVTDPTPSLISEAIFTLLDRVRSGDKNFQPERLRSWVEMNYSSRAQGEVISSHIRELLTNQNL